MALELRYAHRGRSQRGIWHARHESRSQVTSSRAYGQATQRYVQYFDKGGRRLATTHEVLTVDQTPMVIHRDCKEVIDYSNQIRYLPK
jgi:hypothetical protein